VEVQLLKEVAARSVSFFTAAASLQQLRAMLGDTVGAVKAIREQVRPIFVLLSYKPSSDG